MGKGDPWGGVLLHETVGAFSANLTHRANFKSPKFVTLILSEKGQDLHWHQVGWGCTTGGGWARVRGGSPLGIKLLRLTSDWPAPCNHNKAKAQLAIYTLVCF